MKDKKEEAFERFAVMTVDGHCTDKIALDYIMENYGIECVIYIKQIIGV